MSVAADSPRTPAEHAEIIQHAIQHGWAYRPWSEYHRRTGASLAALVALADDDATAFDAGAESVNGEIVCSVCGTNHDRDESAACEGCEPMRLDEWVAHVGALAERPVGRLADDEVCACLSETGERQVEIVERCVRCGALMRSDAYHDAVALAERQREALETCSECCSRAGGCVDFDAILAGGAGDECQHGIELQNRETGETRCAECGATVGAGDE